MRICDLADKPAKAGPWRSEDNEGFFSCGGRTVYHYSTTMLSWELDCDGLWNGDLGTVVYSTGHGSVSDQGGMNQLFARLGMPLYFSRAGGSEIQEMDKPLYRYGITPGTSRLVKRYGEYVQVTV